MSAQLSLDYSYRPIPPVRDQRVPKERRKALCQMSLHILSLLSEGPKTNLQIAAEFPPSTAWRTRISDVRLWLERNTGETVKSEHIDKGIWLYRIVPQIREEGL